MAIGLIGKKRGMTRVFTENGQSVPVTVVEVVNNRLSQIKTEQSDGYTAVQVACGSRKPQKVTAPMKGHFAKQGVEAAEKLLEFRVDVAELEGKSVGDTLNVDLFENGQKVDVRGTSIGKGYAGVIKRHNFRTQDNTHGNSVSHRAPGSIGQNQTPGRVFKGKKMAGHMGNVRKTVQNLEVVRVDNERSLLLIKGAVPGHKDGFVVVTPAVKSRG